MATFKDVFDLNENFYSAKLDGGKYRVLSGRQFRSNFHHHDDATHVLYHDKASDSYSAFRRDPGSRKIASSDNHHEKFQGSDDKLHPQERPAAPEKKGIKTPDDVAAYFLKMRAKHQQRTA